jgi:alcohol dehydrogenase class IV
MRSFQHASPPLRVFQGPDSLRFLGRELERLGCRRAVVVCGRSLARDEALLGQVLSAIPDRCAGVFPGVQAHSPAPAVEEAAQALRRLAADAVIAIGGGSAIVTARAASILLAEPGDLASLATAVDPQGRLRSPKLLAAKLPQLIIPTTPNTAMVRAGSAVFDPAAGERRALFDPKTRAQAIFIHPDFAASAPLALTVASALNSFAFVLEGLLSPSGDPIADALLMHGLCLTARALPNPALASDAALRCDLMLAAVIGGQGTNATGAGIVTTLGHVLGARHRLENGIANAIVLPHALRFDGEAAWPGLRKVASALDLAVAADASPTEPVIAGLARLLAPLGLPQRLRDAGIPGEALAGLAALGMADWFLRGNPRPVREAAELRQVLEAAW